MSHNTLRSAVRGRVLLPGDKEFDTARTPWNLNIDQPVAAVVHVEDAEDMAAVVGYARDAGLSVTAQPNGHGASGDTAGTILVRTRRLDQAEVDPARRRARVGAGASWGEVLAAAAPHGLTGLAGSSPVVSVVGYTLGGGMSWFGRKYGWAADSVRAFDIVDADGRQARVTADSDPDLFWALRGGGGDFALVTAMEFDLFAAPALFGGLMAWPAAQTEAVRDAFQYIVENAPAELTVWLHRLELPQSPPVIAIAAAYLGESAHGRDLMRWLDTIDGKLADTRRELSPAELGAIVNEPTAPGPGLLRTELLTELDETAAEILLHDPIDPMMGIQLRQLGGALGEPTRGAVPSFAEPYALCLQAIGSDPDTVAAVHATQKRIIADLGARVSGRKPYTVLSAGDSVAEVFDTGTIDRLRKIKQARDPHGVFRANFPIPH
ncbi:FAD-binding oxidoreductase [Nocardia sp. NEAU-G5]|uniref:FAD-binding oxidoreductase n=1 Tax=Nocardia albiluteola TaxID=2842303 RepID=A0ABS6B9M9_9NOCA|nr:FAD-binding oxidoreductase [Nocardia albiluteola]MBU3067008.1 FAD-binding oxidoreductase [Nocardia albiluteola]